MAIITRSQCRAARGWLQWTQMDLADRSMISAPTLINFERGHTVPNDKILTSMVAAFGKAGITLTFDTDGMPLGIEGTIQHDEEPPRDC